MAKQIIIGVVPADSAQAAIDNLVEADIPESDITLIMKDEERARRILGAGGPLAGITADTLQEGLARIGITDTHTIDTQFHALSALLAVTCASQTIAAVQDIMTDNGVTSIWGT